MELLESLFVNKKNFRILVIVYIIVVIGVLVWIWFPKSTTELAKYEPYNEEQKCQEMINYYANMLNDIKIYCSAKEYESYINQNYLYRNNISVDEAINMLKSTDQSFTVKNYKLYKYGDDFIYSISLPSGKDKLDVNIVEKSYPYNFYITYGTFVEYSEIPKYGSLEGASIKIVSTYNDLNYVEYELEITNNQESDFTVDLSNADYVYLELSDGNKVRLNLVKSTQGKLKIASDETERIKLVFDISISNQDKINSFNLNNILSKTSKTSAKITL